MYKKDKKGVRDSSFSSEFYDEINAIEKKFNVSDKEIVELLKERPCDKERIPICILQNKKLGAFEAIVKYLHENCRLKFKDISVMLNRSQFTIASSYKSAKSKLDKKFSIKNSEFDIPTKILANRELSPLENISFYLKNTFGMKFSEIGQLLCLNQRTIWTVYARAKKKSQQKKEPEMIEKEEVNNA